MDMNQRIIKTVDDRGYQRQSFHKMKLYLLLISNKNNIDHNSSAITVMTILNFETLFKFLFHCFSSAIHGSSYMHETIINSFDSFKVLLHNFSI